MVLKAIVSGLTKFFTREKIIIFIALIILAYALFAYSDSKSVVRDNLEDGSAASGSAPGTGAPSVAPPAPETIGAPSAGGYALQPVANPADLLPKDQNSQWSALNPVAMNQGAIATPDLLSAGVHIGLDSISGSLRNANQTIRADPYIPKQVVSPFLNSTIEPSFQVPLEIGYGAR
jgi:hypothetical protein